MEIHKPKPWHGFREFLKEYLIIVVGVLTALGAEQAVERQHWRHKIAQAEDAMRAELSQDNGPQGYARLVSAACFDAQLAALEKPAAAGSDRQAFRKLALEYDPPQRTWDSQAWQAMVASDAGTHMDAQEFANWAMTYQDIPSLNRSAETEKAELTDLTALRDVPGPLSPEESSRAVQIIARLRRANLGLAISSKVLLSTMKNAGAAISPSLAASILQEGRRRFGSCASDPAQLPPIGSPFERTVSQFPSRASRRALIGLAPEQ